eukprot:g8791.t1
MNIDIPDLLRALGVDERESEKGGKVVQGECETIFRLSIKKLQHLGKGGEFLRSYVAVDLALGTLGISFSKKALLRKANNTKEKTYDDNYRRIKNVLGTRVAPMGGNIANLAVKFSGASVERSLALLRTYQDACRFTVTAEHGDRLMGQYSTPGYHAAAFCVASVEDKFKLNRKAVAEAVKLHPKDLDKICTDMVTKCGLSSVEHVAKAFRMETPDSAHKGKEARAARGGEGGVAGGAGSKGKGKRPFSPRQRGRGEGGGGGGTGSAGGPGDEVESPAATTSTRLDGLEGGGRSPASPHQSDRLSVGGGAEKRLNFLETGRMGAPQQPADPAASLNLFVKRLRTLRSASYEDWCLTTLETKGGREDGLAA